MAVKLKAVVLILHCRSITATENASTFFDLPQDQRNWDELILQNLKTMNYGRCVYKMDNDQPDHLTVNILFKNGITAAF